MLTRSKAIEVAESLVGYYGKKNYYDDLDIKEAPNGAGEWTKYGRDLYNAGFYNGNKNGYDGWCTLFKDYVFLVAAGFDKATADRVNPNGSLGAGARWSYEYYENKGLITKDPKPGDVYFCKGDNEHCWHVGFVVKREGNVVTTVEGNVTGNVTAYRTHNLSEANAKFGTPLYDPEPEPTPVEPTIFDGEVEKKLDEIIERLDKLENTVETIKDVVNICADGTETIEKVINALREAFS